MSNSIEKANPREAQGWSPHAAECAECGASTHSNGEMIHCDRCDWWVEVGDLDV